MRAGRWVGLQSMEVSNGGAEGLEACCNAPALSCVQIEFDEFLLMFRDQLLDLRVSNSVALRDRSRQPASYTSNAPNV